jgi:YHS domain-containing protein
MNRFSTFLAASALTLTSAVAAIAGEQFVDKTGFAVSGYDVVAYHSIAQNPVGQSQPDAVPGKANITADYNGAKFAFSTEANRDTFLTDPAKYAPQYDGHCAYGVAQGGKVPGNPNLWRILDGKLYLNITKNVVSFWEEDIPGNIKKSENNWVRLDAKPATKNKIPNFMSAAPVN